MSKKLPAALQKLLDEHKQAWAVDEQELSKRIASAKVNYNRWPIAGDIENYAQISVFKNTFYEFLQEIKNPNWIDFDIDYSRSNATNGFKVFFIKPEALQEQDIERITTKVEQQYLSELEQVKQEYIENLLFEYNEQQALAKADKDKEQQTSLRKQLLSMID